MQKNKPGKWISTQQVCDRIVHAIMQTRENMNGFHPKDLTALCDKVTCLMDMRIRRDIQLRSF